MSEAPENHMTVEDWCEKIVWGAGGLHEYKYYEMAELHRDGHVEGALWALQCLANPASEGSKTVLEAIAERRERLAKEG